MGTLIYVFSAESKFSGAGKRPFLCPNYEFPFCQVTWIPRWRRAASGLR